MTKDQFKVDLAKKISWCAKGTLDGIADGIIVTAKEPVPDVSYVYNVSCPGTAYDNTQYSLYDDGFNGIRISFYNVRTKKDEVVEHIYHWDDAYSLLLECLEDTQDFGVEGEPDFGPYGLQRREDGTINISASLGKMPYSFRWEGLAIELDLFGLPDDFLLSLLQLVEYGYIDELNPEYVYGDVFHINPHAKIPPCSIPLPKLVDKMRQMYLSGESSHTPAERSISIDWVKKGITLHSWPLPMNGCDKTFSLGLTCRVVEPFLPPAEYAYARCRGTYCIVWLCAFLEYAANNNILYDLMQKRERFRQADEVDIEDYRVDADDLVDADDMDDADDTDDKSAPEPGHLGYEERLTQIIGLNERKDRVRSWVSFAKNVKRYEAATGEKYSDGTMHMVFTGNPGTGKTTIAGIMADVLFELGYTKKRHMEVVRSTDLLTSYVGNTVEKAREAVERARGGVLFIDEAYSLVPMGQRGGLGDAVIDVLMEAMDKGGIIMIFAGYSEEMCQFIDYNPGLRSRISQRGIFHFKDFTSEELREIYRRELELRKFAVSNEALDKAEQVLKTIAKDENFGNGRSAKELARQTWERHIENNPDVRMEIDAEDVPELYAVTNKPKPTRQLPDLENVIGLTSVKAVFEKFKSDIEFDNERKKQGKKPLSGASRHMVFRGNPGTGKTMMARIIAKELYNIGVTTLEEPVEVERKDLVAGYIGQTALKTGDAIKRAMGGVLFIDEAYSLAKDSERDFGKEAIETLIKAMEDYKDDLIVIFAGYTEDMDKLLDSNPGLRSRIGYTFDFEDYSAEDLQKIYVAKMKKSGLEVTKAAREKLEKLMQYFCRIPRFGNGRFVDQVIDETKELLKKRLNDDPEANIDVIDAEAVPEIKDLQARMSARHKMPTPEEVTDEDLRRISIHESGHTLAQKLLFPDSPIKRLTICAEGTGALGYMQQERRNFGLQNTVSVYKNEITVLMAGLAAEKVFLGDHADGGIKDIEYAAAYAMDMITRRGMSRHGPAGPSSEKELKQEVNEILDACFHRAEQLVEGHRDQVQRMVDRLLEKKDLTDEDVTEILATQPFMNS